MYRSPTGVPECVFRHFGFLLFCLQRDAGFVFVERSPYPVQEAAPRCRPLGNPQPSHTRCNGCYSVLSILAGLDWTSWQGVFGEFPSHGLS
uniref:Secreted protein n=1 Tax=Mesocestoides corti TaxID=53468 RepID=A0A5K3G327_MESCO